MRKKRSPNWLGVATFATEDGAETTIEFISRRDLEKKVDEMVEQCWPGKIPFLESIQYSEGR
jgi:hypothetical protein